ncbi:hypothetical protein EVAR_6390_1 [Eumeta japonica]|uniref:Uncharacterized protein n=1 Tax=Eumeta variegata TaxID=151549 RepID=A0A4C1TDK1_EUMVA|nr:hypothetical protein EVAR_6390_1 [Eumeta japonica]
MLHPCACSITYTEERSEELSNLIPAANFRRRSARRKYHQHHLDAGTHQEQTEKIIVLPSLAILAPPRVYALCLGTGGTALFTALGSSKLML